MADRITQLQDQVNQLAEHFCNAVGVLQNSAPHSSFDENDSSQTTQSLMVEDYITLFSQLITRTAKDIDVLVDALPSEESTADLQIASIRKLQVDNEEAAKRLEKAIKEGEKMLTCIQDIQHKIAAAQLRWQFIEAGQVTLDPSASDNLS